MKVGVRRCSGYRQDSTRRWWGKTARNPFMVIALACDADDETEKTNTPFWRRNENSDGAILWEWVVGNEMCG